MNVRTLQKSLNTSREMIQIVKFGQKHLVVKHAEMI